jgi:hypothetical protein
MSALRSATTLRGDYHRRLRGVLLEALARQAITQESLGVAVQMHQTTIGGILKKDEGTLDLDEADAALRHIGSSLRDFISDPMNVVAPPVPSKTVLQLASTLAGLEDDDLRIVLGVARSVRTRSRAKKKSNQPRDVGRSMGDRKTAGRRRGA